MTAPYRFQGHAWQPIDPEDYEQCKAYGVEPGDRWYRWYGTLLLIDDSAHSFQHLAAANASGDAPGIDEAWENYLLQCSRHEVQP